MSAIINPAENTMPTRISNDSTLDDDHRQRTYKQVASLAVIETLRAAIVKTLDDNAHLADGENCTLLALKIALRETGEPWEGEL